MSLILDALRKSERERRQAEAPVFGSVAAGATLAPPRRFATWPVAAIAAAAVAVVLAWAYFGGRMAPPLHTAESGAPPAAPAAPATETPKAQPDVASAPELKPNPFAAAPPQNGGTVRDLAKEARVPRPAPEPALHRQPQQVALAPPAPAVPPQEAVKFLRAMPPEFQRALPELVVNIHIYAPREADRILYINNRQYHAGDRLRDDIVIEEIVEDGAVLRYRGRRFKLPRPS